MHDARAAWKPDTTRVIATLATFWLWITFTGASANAQATVPCRYEVAHLIQGPICPITQAPALTVGTAISPSGRYVCGYYRLCGPSEDSPFVFDTIMHEFFTIPLPSGFYAASCADVNDAGVVVGTALRTNVGQRGFIYRMETGEWTELLPLPGGVWSAATGVNSSDTVCGWRSIGPGTHPQTAFRWTLQSGFEDLGLIDGLSTGASAINASDTYIGWKGNSALSRNTRALMYASGKLTVLDPIPGGINSTATSLNNSGQFLLSGQYVINGSPDNFVYDDGTLTHLDPLPGYQGTTACLDSAGVAMGRSRTSSLPLMYRPTYWIDGVPYDLLLLYPPNSDIGVNGPIDVSGAGELLINSSISSTCYVLAPVYRSPGDTNCDQAVNALDLLNVVNSWGQCGQCEVDLNSDGLVNVSDLLIVVFNWSP